MRARVARIIVLENIKSYGPWRMTITRWQMNTDCDYIINELLTDCIENANKIMWVNVQKTCHTFFLVAFFKLHLIYIEERYCKHLF